MEIMLYLAKLLMAWTLLSRSRVATNYQETVLEPLSKSYESRFNDEGKERTALREQVFLFLKLIFN
tara:strand:- start:150 stop:347 length:198 start_codon:yes stop_codon:yes gene_type:complete